MKIEVWTNSNANIKSENRITVDIDEIGFSEDEWNKLSNEEKDKAILEFCWETEMLSWGWQNK